MIDSSAGVPAVTVNLFASVTTSAPVVTVTEVAPRAAAAVMLTFTVTLVAVGDPVGALAVTPVLPKVTTDAPLKCVKLPVMVTGAVAVPCCPLFGFTCVITGVPFVTVKLLASVTTSAPVVTVTEVAPRAAAAVMLTFTVTLVAVGDPVGALAVTPVLPKVTTDAPLKCVKLPVMVTGAVAVPCCPLFGFTCVITGVPFVTVKLLASVTTSAPVVTVTEVAPSAAAAVMLTFTVTLVAVGDPVGALAVTPALPKVTTDAPLKCVKLPVIVTGTAAAPC